MNVVKIYNQFIKKVKEDGFSDRS